MMERKAWFFMMERKAYFSLSCLAGVSTERHDIQHLHTPRTPPRSILQKGARNVLRYRRKRLDETNARSSTERHGIQHLHAPRTPPKLYFAGRNAQRPTASSQKADETGAPHLVRERPADQVFEEVGHRLRLVGLFFAEGLARKKKKKKGQTDRRVKRDTWRGSKRIGERGSTIDHEWGQADGNSSFSVQESESRQTEAYHPRQDKTKETRERITKQV